MPIKYIGRTNIFSGKTLWEIVGNLKNFGVGRIVVRSTFERYAEPSYLKICKVETLPNEETRKVRVWVEKVFRGKKYPRLTEICSTSYKADYRLIPRHEEESYCKFDASTAVPVKVLPQTVPFPPLFKELILRDLKAKALPITEEPKLRLRYRDGRDNVARIAADGEKPSIEISQGLGKPVSPQLYSNVLQ